MHKKQKRTKMIFLSPLNHKDPPTHKTTTLNLLAL